MKAITIIKKIREENACSIHTCEMLNRALRREGYMSNDWNIRFMPLYARFDFVNNDFTKSVYGDCDPYFILDNLLNKDVFKVVR